MESLLESVPKASHKALRGWHTGECEDGPWRDMLVVRQRLSEHPIPNLELAVKEVILQALAALEQQADGSLAQILRVRFLDGLTAAATANRLNLTENVVYKHQRAALQELVTNLLAAEEDARLAKAAHVLSRLEIQEPPHLFGVDDKKADLIAILTTQAGHWLVALIGIGGIGKTSLADSAVRDLAQTPVFSDIAWVSARQDRFTLWDGLREECEATPALTIEGLVDALLVQLGLQDLAHLPLAEKRAGLCARLKAQPYLVVVDNLETAADYRALIPELQGMVNPTKFLLTSRHSLHDYSGVHGLGLDELSSRDSLALLRHEAGERGLTHVSAAAEETLMQVYEVTGGNPLALKLLVGQMYALSLPKIVEDLREARGRTVEDLYRFIFWRSWNVLDDAARRVLAILPLVAESGAGLEQVAKLADVADEQLTTALRQLVTLCLVNVRGPAEARRYSIHRLTETFLLNEVLKWQRLP